MGNAQYKYHPIEELQATTYKEMSEMALNKKIQKYVASGIDIYEALDNLEKICINNGIPKPQKTDNIYHCGNITIINYDMVKKLNTIFFKKRGDRIFAIVFYPPI